MAFEISIPTEEQWPELMRVDARGFGWVPSDEITAKRRLIIDLERFRIATDGGRIVGVAGSFAFDMTLPGGTSVPMAGVTWVSVSATHRRQGVLTALIAAVHADADDRGEPVAALYASEGGIYRRFGYGAATTGRRVTIQRIHAQLRPELTVAPGAVQYADADDIAPHERAVWDRFRRLRAGEVSGSEVWEQRRFMHYAEPDEGYTPGFHLAHADGFAIYRIKEQWGTGFPSHELFLEQLVALTPQAHLDLWHAVLSVDLVGTIVTRVMPIDDPLVHLLVNPRALSTAAVHDGLWVHVRGPGVAFGARAYGSADRLVIEADGRRWSIESDGEESSCRTVRSRPDLVTDGATLGSLLLGGVAPSELVAGHRIAVRNAATLRRADVFFSTRPASHCATFF
ncbi:MAG: GNAT family N-acetyltransferase [Ilumatobacteraceae bacterium]